VFAALALSLRLSTLIPLMVTVGAVGALFYALGRAFALLGGRGGYCYLFRRFLGGLLVLRL